MADHTKSNAGPGDPLKEIAATALELNRKAEEATSEIQRVNAELAGANVGVEVWTDESFTVYDVTYDIGYARDDRSNRWGLMLRDVGNERTPLVSAKRSLRIAAAKLIPALLVKLQAKLKQDNAS